MYIIFIGIPRVLSFLYNSIVFIGISYYVLCTHLYN